MYLFCLIPLNSSHKWFNSLQWVSIICEILWAMLVSSGVTMSGVEHDHKHNSAEDWVNHNGIFSIALQVHTRFTAVVVRLNNICRSMSGRKNWCKWIFIILHYILYKTLFVCFLQKDTFKVLFVDWEGVWWCVRSLWKKRKKRKQKLQSVKIQWQQWRAGPKIP